MSFKIAHVSDVHAGYKSTRRLNAQGLNLREADGYIVFSKIISEAIDEKVDALLVAGDIFHIPTPEVRAILFVQNQLRRLAHAKIPVYILAGNHDTNDVKSDIAASRLLHDPARHIYSHVEPYVHHEIGDGINLHLISHHMYSEQSDTMNSITPQEGEINILSTHGSVIDPLLKEKLHTEQSPREIVIPDFLIEDNDWDYVLLGHIHERGWVGSKDGKTDTSKKKIYYNGSIVRRGFSDKECKLGRGWTLWEIDSNGTFTPTHKTIAQRPQVDFDIIDAKNLSSKEISDVVIDNLITTQSNGREFDSRTAPILRQRISNIETSKYSALDWANINNNSEHALAWNIKTMINSPTDEKTKSFENNEHWDSSDVVKIYDEWITDSETYSKTDKSLKDIVKEQARNFVELGQEVVLNE